MKEIIIATKNAGKAKEFQAMFLDYGYQVKTLLDYPEIAEIEETGTTFEENAVLKAETLSKILNKIVIADDSGLIVDALNGAPGVYSARYAGEPKSDERNMEKLLEELKDVPENQRYARFHCSLAVAIPNKKTLTFSGQCEGFIMLERRGTNGFGYDPLFFVEELQRPMAELQPFEKAQISHRGKALKKLETILDVMFDKEETI